MEGSLCIWPSSIVLWLHMQGGEMSQEQYAAMSAEEQAAYWAQWQYYSQYYAAAPSSSAPQQQPDYAAQYQQQLYQVRAHAQDGTVHVLPHAMCFSALFLAAGSTPSREATGTSMGSSRRWTIRPTTSSRQPCSSRQPWGTAFPCSSSRQPWPLLPHMHSTLLVEPLHAPCICHHLWYLAQGQGQIMYNAYASSAPGAAPTMYMQTPAAMVPGTQFP